MIVVEASHAHVMKFLPLYTHITLMWRELSIVPTVNQRSVFTDSHNFDHFHMERQP
jgi:hypothetical protein